MYHYKAKTLQAFTHVNLLEFLSLCEILVVGY